MGFNENKFISITEATKQSKEFVKRVNDEGEVMVLQNNKPCYVALSFDHYKELNDEIEMLREYMLLHPRLADLDNIDIGKLKEHKDLKKEGYFD